MAELWAVFCLSEVKNTEKEKDLTMQKVATVLMIRTIRTGT